MIELESATFDEQLERAVTPQEVVQAVATRAAMLRRQGIDSDLAYSRDIVQQIKHEQACERAHQRAAIAIKALIVCALIGLYFGVLA